MTMSCEGTWLVTKGISASREGLVSTKSPVDFITKRPPYMLLQVCPGLPLTFYQRWAHPQPLRLPDSREEDKDKLVPEWF